jgi:phenylpropionate dioxygenase-like ring-hydroxylating dioxygenase large terminal subunit
VVSTVLPRGPNHCTNVVEFYYTEEVAMFEREFVQAEQAAFDETAKEDETICQMLHNGRKALYDIGVNDAMGPYQTPTEDGIQVFHEWMRRELDPHI